MLCGLDDVGQILTFTGLQDFPPLFTTGGLISVWQKKNLGVKGRGETKVTCMNTDADMARRG